MAKRDSEFVTTRNLTVSVRDANQRVQTLHIQSGVTFEYSEDEKGYVVRDPRNADEESILVDDATYSAWKEVRSIVTPQLKEELESIAGSSNVALEKKVVELTTKVAELEDENEALKEQLERAQATIKTLTGSLQADSKINTNPLGGGDEDDDDQDEKDKEVAEAGLPTQPTGAEKKAAAKKAAQAAK